MATIEEQIKDYANTKLRQLKVKMSNFHKEYLEENKAIDMNQIKKVDSVLDKHNKNVPLKREASNYPLLKFMNKIEEIKADQKIKKINDILGQIDFDDNEKNQSVTDGFHGPYIYLDDSVYYGQYKNGMRHGRGWTYHHGTIYQGSFTNDYKNGKGRLIDSQYNCYEGMWHNGKIQGKGMIINLNKQQYEGEFSMNQKNGNGQETFNNGFVYKGQYRNEVFDGKCKISFNDSRCFKGQIRNNRLKDGVFEFNKTMKYDGEWKNDRPHGKGQFIMSEQSQQINVEVQMENGKVKTMDQMHEQYRQKINQIDYAQLDKDMEYIISNRIQLVSNESQSVQIEQEFAEFIDINRPYHFGTQNMRNKVSTKYERVNDEQINDLMLEQEIEMCRESYAQKYVLRQERNTRPYRFIDRDLNMNQKQNGEVLVDQKEEILDIYAKNQIKNMQILNQYKRSMSERLSQEEEDRMSQYLNNEANLRSMILRSMSTNSAAFQSNLANAKKQG